MHKLLQAGLVRGEKGLL